MHTSAFQNCKKFVEKYLKDKFDKKLNILDVGSLNVNGTLKSLFAAHTGWKYTGMDISAGKNVDVVLKNAYKYPFDNSCFDVVVSTTVFEHDPMFWISFFEMARVVKNKGYIYICTPSAGPVHEYPLDCWRFYPGAYKALSIWCPKAKLIETYIGNNIPWKDNIGIFNIKK